MVESLATPRPTAMSLPPLVEHVIPGGGVRPRERSASTRAPAIREHLLSSRKRYLAALDAALLSGVACIATLIEPRWLELLLGKSPDGRDGSLETIIAVAVAASLGACVLFGLLAWRERRREAAIRAVIVKDLA